MNERSGDDIVDEDVDEVDEVEDGVEAVVDDDDSDDIDLTGEVNIESLVAKLDATPQDDLARKRAIRKRVEELRDIREAEKDLDSTYNFNLDDEL